MIKQKDGSIRRRKPNKILQSWQLYVMILPALIYILVFAYKPMYGVIIAFKNFSLRKGIMDSAWVGFDNFTRFFKSYWFPIIMKNTLLISGLSLVIGFPIPIILSLMVNEIRRDSVKRIFQTASYAPYFISTVVICGMVKLFLNPNTGIVNQIMGFFGADPVYFMQDPTKFKWIYVISGVWQNAGWGAVIYFAALSGVDKSLHEAADIDGASRFKKIIHINLPVLVPTIIVLFIINCGSLLNIGYEKVFLLQNSTNLSGSEVISTYVYKMGLEQQDFSFSTAAGLFNSIINSAILIITNSLSKKFGETSLW